MSARDHWNRVDWLIQFARGLRAQLGPASHAYIPADPGTLPVGGLETLFDAWRDHATHADCVEAAQRLKETA